MRPLSTPININNTNNNINNSNAEDPIYVYLASDNEEVKDRLS